MGFACIGRRELGHDETVLIYMRVRYYEPWTGRFISEDPGRDGVNWYLYADGNPVNKVDADGKGVLTDTIGLLLSLIAMYIIARENPFYALLWVSWMAAFGTSLVGISILYGAFGTDVALSFSLGANMGLVIGATIAYSKIKSLYAKSLQAQVIQFFEGYIATLAATMFALDLEYTLLTGEGFVENLGFESLPRR